MARKYGSGSADLKKMADSLLKQAEAKGLGNHFFFVSTFERYLVQLDILKDLEKAIKEFGMTVEKEYVKGRQNLVANPAISEYNKTSTAANGTVSTLLNILKSIPAESDGSKLSEFLDDE